MRRLRSIVSFVAITIVVGLTTSLPLHAQTVTGVTGGGNFVDNTQPTLVVTYVIAMQGIFPDPNATANLSAAPDRSYPFLGEIRPVAFNYAPKGWARCNGQLLQINQNQALFSLLGTRYGGNGVTNFALPNLIGRVPIGAGQGPGLGAYTSGQVVGANAAPLAVDNLPSHTHHLPPNLVTGASGRGAPFDNHQASLAVNFLISTNGELMIAPFDVVPGGWLPCDGRFLDPVARSYLFNNIGYRYGRDSAGNFAIPDTRGRVIIGDDGTTNWPIALSLGSETAVLGLNDIPVHAHTTPNGDTDQAGGSGHTASNYQPSLAMRWVISLYGLYPSPTSAQRSYIAPNAVGYAYVGELRIIAAPAVDTVTSDSWAPVFGTLFDIAQNDTLFQVLGTTYGGDGNQTFAIPDLRAAAASHFGNGTVPGELLGSATMNIAVSQLAPHSHSLSPIVTGIHHFADHHVELNLAGIIGTTGQLDYSDDFATWNNLGQVQFTTSTQTTTDLNGSHSGRRFYRVHSP